MSAKVLLATTVPYSAAARLAEAFAKLGAGVEAVFPSNHPLAVSRYVARAYRYRALAPQVSLHDAIAAAAPDYVIPCDDRAVALLATSGDFAALIARSIGPQEYVRQLLHRAPSLAALREAGAVAPLTEAVASRAALAAALARIGLPCVMKTDLSWGGAGVKFVATEAEAAAAFAALQGPPSRLRSLYRAVKRRDLHFLEMVRAPHKAIVNLQTLVPGRPATTAFVARDGKVLAVQHMDVVSWRDESGPATVMARVADAAMDEAARLVAAHFHLDGLHGLDFMRDEAGVPHLIEVNPRATQICHLPLDADLPAALLGVPRRPAATERKQIALFPNARSAPPGAYHDVPFDDPDVVKALSV